MAKSKPTGTKSGSKNTNVRNPASNPERTPEKYRVSLFFVVDLLTRRVRESAREKKKHMGFTSEITT
jgi:hypothetical protein